MKVTSPIPRRVYRVEPVHRAQLDYDIAQSFRFDNAAGARNRIKAGTINSGHASSGTTPARRPFSQTPTPYFFIAGGLRAPGTGGLVDVRI